MNPTDQQLDVLKKFGEGEDMVVEAGAGTGKTSTLVLLAKSCPEQQGLYVSFGKAIVNEAKGKMPANMECQPDGSMVRVPTPGTNGGRSHQVAIETLADGDLVTSWKEEGNVLRKRGRSVIVTKRAYDGPLVTATIGSNHSQYTPEHPCLVTIGDAFEGEWIVYMMERNGFYKIGMCSWTTYDGRNGLVRRAQQEDVDAFWILSAHASRSEALNAEALAQYEGHVPGWCFRLVDESEDLRLWSKVAPNHRRAGRCLASFGRDISRPLWSKGQPMRFGQQIIITAACNLMTGMRMLVADDSESTHPSGRLSSPRRLWTRATIGRTWYEGNVTSLEVAKDHTYIADGILTHNCRTAHSLAYGAVGWKYKKRMDSNRVLSSEIGRLLNLRPYNVTNMAGETATLRPSWLAGLVMSAMARFCNTADEVPSAKHVPRQDGLDKEGNAKLANHLAPFLLDAWADLTKVDGRLRFFQDVYLKLWQLSKPVIRKDFILYDEAQDASPVMTAVFKAQEAQVVAVGDSQQQIYEFRGAVNALAMFGTDNRSILSQSWRFGDAIAEVANQVLDNIPNSVLRLQGCPGMDSRIDSLDRPHALLCRTNAKAVGEVLRAQQEGVSVHLVGNSGKEVLRFAKGALELMEQGYTMHAEMACFTSWEQVQEYVNTDAQGAELRLMVRLIDDFGVQVILDALAPERMTPEHKAELVVSTAHQAKGREWPTVRLGGDFPTGLNKEGEPVEVPPEEWRLLYVAVTRARMVLDINAVALLNGSPVAAAA